MSFKKVKKLKPDSFFGVSKIFGLQEDTFSNYINEKDVALVMFYDPKSPFSKLSKTHFVKATQTNKRGNVAFAAVNCEDERRLCLAENITNIPSFKLYSHGQLLSDQGVVNDYRKIVNSVMEAPVLPPKPTSRTMAKFFT
ncbi:unnamed protein product [Candidula unifasciata]|uniref:Thioredoxin domain-containing protein n=1 Tax=Candidula unifasciata TaxID=100452 RepID=A0A8S3YVE7_9EUPU|nr:unnamed protein product [Candidula unifasciata]